MIGETSKEDCLRHILPPLPSTLKDKIDNIFNTLKEKHIYNSDTNRWAGFEVDPSVSKQREPTVFQPLVKIFDAVVEAALGVDPSLEQNFRLVVAGNSAPTSDLGSDLCPNAWFEISDKALKKMAKSQEELMKKDGWHNMPKTKDEPTLNANADEKKHSPSVYEITSPQEFKKRSGAVGEDDDITKLYWNMSKLLALDPTRRFTLGLTIEDCLLRLWTISRGTLLKSETTHFCEDACNLVQIFISFAFSSPEDMGWDPSITFSHIDAKGQRQYNIFVDGHVYNTVAILSDYSADNPFGRAVRVWKVRDAKGNTHVLKDLWLEFDCLEEHLIYDAILSDVKELEKREGGKDYLQDVKKHMLTPLHYGRAEVFGKVDDTKEVILRGYDIKTQAKLVPLLYPSKPAPVKRQSVGPSYPGNKDRFPPPQSQPSAEKIGRPGRVSYHNIPNTQRYHYRIVFEQYATTIYHEQSLRNGIRALHGIITALYDIHRAGWVHRDLSSGNLYYYGKEDVGLIGDFEYAKRINDLHGHVVRTGTPFFMACETLTHSYLFWQKAGNNLVDDNLTDKPPSVLRRQMFKAPLLTQIPTPPKAPLFVYNPCHDLESIWWVLVWMLFFNNGESAAGESLPQNRQSKMDDLFDGNLNNNQRYVFLRDPVTHGYLSPLLDFLQPAVRQYATYLTDAYRHAERNYPVIEHMPLTLHTKVAQILHEVLQQPNVMLVHVKE